MSYESGRLFNFLLKHRILRTKVPAGKKAKPEEKSFVELYTQEMPEVERAWFEDFLAGMGFKIKAYQGNIIRGIPRDATYYILVRDSNDETTPTWVSPEELYKLIALRAHESKTESKLWTFIIWMSLLSIMYTKINRSPQQVSQYQDVEFTEPVLSESVRHFVENIRDEADERPDNVYVQYLSSEKGQEIETRVGRFLKFLTSISHLDFFPQNGIYTQTLIGAAEIEQQFDRGLEHLIPQENLDSQTLNLILSHAENEELEEIA